MDRQFSADTEVRDRGLSEIPDLTGDPHNKSGIPLNGFGKPTSGDVHSWHACSHKRQDIRTVRSRLFVSGIHQVFDNFNSEFSNICE